MKLSIFLTRKSHKIKVINIIKFDKEKINEKIIKSLKL